jgi:hypothetical protein
VILDEHPPGAAEQIDVAVVIAEAEAATPVTPDVRG